MKRHMKVRPGLAVFLVACIEVGIRVQGEGSKENRCIGVCFAGFTDLVTSNRDFMYVTSLNSALKSRMIIFLYRGFLSEKTGPWKLKKDDATGLN